MHIFTRFQENSSFFNIIVFFKSKIVLNPRRNILIFSRENNIFPAKNREEIGTFEYVGGGRTMPKKFQRQEIVRHQISPRAAKNVGLRRTTLKQNERKNWCTTPNLHPHKRRSGKLTQVFIFSFSLKILFVYLLFI